MTTSKTKAVPADGATDQLSFGFDDADANAKTAAREIDRSTLLRTLAEWSEAGWLRRLDCALSVFIATLSPQASPAALLAIALVSNLEGQGHSCMDLQQLVASAGASMEWADEAAHALTDTMGQLPRDLSAWADAIRSCDAVDAGAADPDGKQPLVLDGGRLYLRRYWRYEQSVASRVLNRLAATDASDPAVLRAWLNRLFPPSTDRAGFDWQKAACAIALRGRLSIVTGGPGTGKTYTAARVLALAFALAPEPQRLRVALAAPTGKAAARLKESIVEGLSTLQPVFADEPALQDLASRMGAARTLHALLGARPGTRAFRQGAANPLDIDVLIVDEASMVHLEMMAALLEALPAHTRVILLGDKDQLASVEAGSVLGDLCAGVEDAEYGVATRAYLEGALGVAVPGAAASGNLLTQQIVMLRESRRFGGPIGALAQAVNAGDAVAAAALLHEPAQQEVSWRGESRASMQPDVVAIAVGSDHSSGYRRYCELLKKRPSSGEAGHSDWVREVLAAYDTFRVLCAVRDGERGSVALNVAIERALVSGGLISRHGEWYEGRPVMVTRNDSAAGVFNGDVGLALKPQQGGGLRVYFAGGTTPRSVLTTRLGHVETAYAMTVHKSQGSEFDHTVLVLSSADRRTASRELVYTGITRARSKFTLVANGSESLKAALAKTTTRGSGLASILAAPDR